MPRYFFDSSALAKAYHVETGTPKVIAILNEAGKRVLHLLVVGH